MINYDVNFLSVILDAVLAQIYNCKGGRVFKMRGFQEIKYLDPVSSLKSVLMKVFRKVYDYRSLFHLNAD